MSATAGSCVFRLPQLMLGAALLLFSITAVAQARLADAVASCAITPSTASCGTPAQAASAVPAAPPTQDEAARPTVWRNAPLAGLLAFQPVVTLNQAAPSVGASMLPAGWPAEGMPSPLPMLLPLVLLGVLAIAAAWGYAGWRRRRQADSLPPLSLPAQGLVAALGRSVGGMAERQGQSLEARRAEIAGAAAELRELAAQTRLMALNARTEAACAGPGGLPMARAAERVDRLACQVARTAQEIGQAIAVLEGEVGEPPAEARAAEGWPAGIALARVHEAALATREQGGGSEAAARKLESVARIIEQVTASLHQTAAALNEATGQARH